MEYSSDVKANRGTWVFESGGAFAERLSFPFTVSKAAIDVAAYSDANDDDDDDDDTDDKNEGNEDDAEATEEDDDKTEAFALVADKNGMTEVALENDVEALDEVKQIFNDAAWAALEGEDVATDEEKDRELMKSDVNKNRIAESVAVWTWNALYAQIEWAVHNKVHRVSLKVKDSCIRIRSNEYS